MTFDSNLYAQRRAQLAAHMAAQAPNSIAIIPTAPERQRNRDSDFLFRHDSYFYYLTGFTEPNAWLVITSDGHSSLFCQPKDLEREIWDGVRLGPEAAPAHLGVNAAWSIAALDAKLPTLLENKAVVWYPFATHKDLSARIETGLNAVRARVRYGALCPEQQRDVCGILDEMRLVKDAHEQDIMRRASAISARAHIRAMQRSAAMLRAGQEVREYHLDAELLHDTDTPERLLMTRQIGDTVNAAMDALPEELRTAIVLREIEGLSYEEIASMMDCPIGTVRSRIFRAREAVALKLRPLLDIAPDRRW